jgi:ketosteroid isomerase-like protein
MLIVVTVMLLASTSTIYNQTVSKAEQELRAADQVWNAAFLKCDPKAFEHIYADDLVFLHTPGWDSKKSFIENISKPPCSVLSSKIETTRVMLYGNNTVGVTVGNETLHRKFAGRGCPGDDCEFMLYFTRVYTKESDGSWKMHTHQSLNVDPKTPKFRPK